LIVLAVTGRRSAPGGVEAEASGSQRPGWP